MTSRRHFIAAGIASGLLGFTSLARAHGDAAHTGKAKTPDAAEQQAWGIAGAPGKAHRTIRIEMSDDMRFTPDRIAVRLGETIRFEHHNTGAVLHEMVIGTPETLAEHAALMMRFPDMVHDEPWMAHVPSGEKAEMTWTFNRAGDFEFACLMPGHYQAGMKGTLIVR